MASSKKDATEQEVSQKDKGTSIAVSQSVKDRLDKYGLKGDSYEMILNRLMNELSAYRIKDGKPAAGVLDQDVRK